MRGIDGNFIHAQGDATARMQLAYQTEQNRQQIKAQMEVAESLKKLREQVVETEKLDSSVVSKMVTDDQGSETQTPFGEEKNDEGSKRKDQEKEIAEDSGETITKTHIDIRA